MAHISGYTGDLIFGTGSSTTAFGPDVDTNGPTIQVQAWTINSEQGFMRGFVKNQAWETTYPTAAKYRVTAQFLLQLDPSMVANDMQIRTDATEAKTSTPRCVLRGNLISGLRYEATGYLTRYDVEDQLDQPAKVTIEFVGNGKLEAISD